MQEVLHIQDLETNLLSVSKICRKGLTMLFIGDSCKLCDEDGYVIASGTEVNALAEAKVFHRRLGHFNQQTNQLNQRSFIRLCDMYNRDTNSLSISFLHNATRRIVRFGAQWSFIGRHYFLTFVDAASLNVFVYFLQSNSSVKDVFRNFKLMSERQTGRKLKVFIEFRQWYCIR